MASVASAFEWFADWAEGVSPLYERLAYASADDEALLDIASEAPEGQPPPNLRRIEYPSAVAEWRKPHVPGE
jgi:hypothetical protein